MEKQPEVNDQQTPKPEHPAIKERLDRMAAEVVKNHPNLTFEEVRARIKEAW